MCWGWGLPLSLAAAGHQQPCPLPHTSSYPEAQQEQHMTSSTQPHCCCSGRGSMCPAPTLFSARRCAHCRPNDLKYYAEKYGAVKDVYLPKDFHTGWVTGATGRQFLCLLVSVCHSRNSSRISSSTVHHSHSCVCFLLLATGSRGAWVSSSFMMSATLRRLSGAWTA